MDRCSDGKGSDMAHGDVSNISGISWWSVFLVEETGVLGEETTDLLQVTDKSLIIL
jgi:hypothetical protein